MLHPSVSCVDRLRFRSQIKCDVTLLEVACGYRGNNHCQLITRQSHLTFHLSHEGFYLGTFPTCPFPSRSVLTRSMWTTCHVKRICFNHWKWQDVKTSSPTSTYINWSESRDTTKHGGILPWWSNKHNAAFWEKQNRSIKRQRPCSHRPLFWKSVCQRRWTDMFSLLLIVPCAEPSLSPTPLPLLSQVIGATHCTLSSNAKLIFGEKR